MTTISTLPPPPASSVKPTHPFRYAAGMFGTSIPITLINGNMAYFYVDKLGMNGAMFAAVGVVYTIIDLFDNPIYGWLSDRTRTRFGRRRPWIVLGVPVLVLAAILVFNPPFAKNGVGLLAWLVVWSILAQTFDSLVNASYGAVLPEAFPDERVRALANSLRQGCQLVALIVSQAVAPLLFQAIGYGRTALVLILIAGIVMLWMGFGIREDMSQLPDKQPGILASLKVIVGNRRFWIIVVASSFYSSAMSLLMGAVAFFVKYGLGLQDSARFFLLGAVIASSILFLLIWTRLLRRVDAVPLWRTALLVLAVALIAMSFAKTLSAAILVGAFIGVGFSGVMATVDLIIARLMDEDTVRTGEHRESMFIAAFGFFNHFTMAIQSLALILMGVWFGYHSGDDPGPTPGAASAFMVSVLPATLAAIAFLAAMFVRVAKLDRRTAPTSPTVEDDR